MNRKSYYFIAGFIVIFIATEIVLRSVWGFCDSPTCLASENYEYIYAPNQNRHRFGNHIVYNAFNMRNEALDSTKTHILGLGDSVLNGGTPTDQSELASTLISRENGIQFLNISAGSWGPDNCAAYLREKGLFNAIAMVLVVSSHDAHDNMDFQPVVDVHPSYPSKQYKLATWEVIHRYLLPRIRRKLKQQAPDPDQAVLQGIHKNGKTFNPGFDALKNIAQQANIPLLIYLHPDRNEQKTGKYNAQGHEIMDWAHQNNIPLKTGLGTGLTNDCYRDGIHLNAKGQRILADNISSLLLEYKLL